MNWEVYFTQKSGWMDGSGPLNDLVISSRVRLARNLADVPFPSRLSPDGQKAVFERVTKASLATAAMAKSEVIALRDIKKVERQFLMERQLISPEIAAEDGHQGVLVAPGQRLSVMINEEDHLRLQSVEAGLDLVQAWRRADAVDSQLGEPLDFAFDSEWGFCTRCPTNAGTGMRASCLLHLPALVLTGDVQQVLSDLPPLGVTARGFYGEGSKALGDLFQISNNTSLGRTEPEIVENIRRVVEGIAHYERKGREALMDARHRARTEDAIYRAWGLLRTARLISYDEAMLLLSRVRLGIQMGFDLPVEPAVLNGLMILAQPAHLQMLKGSSLKTEERDMWRAALIRQKLKEIQPSSD
jgi:protein arginine kinase